MRFSKVRLFAAALVTAAGVSLLSAESINPPTTPQTAPMNAAEKKNLDTVLNWWREVISGRHSELAPKYQADDYIEHNPTISTGRAAFMKFITSLGAPVNPIPRSLNPGPVV